MSIEKTKRKEENKERGWEKIKAGFDLLCFGGKNFLPWSIKLEWPFQAARVEPNINAWKRELEAQNQIQESRHSSSDSSISDVEQTTNQSVAQVYIDPPGSKNVPIPIAGDAFENTGFQSTDDL